VSGFETAPQGHFLTLFRARSGLKTGRFYVAERTEVRERLRFPPPPPIPRPLAGSSQGLFVLIHGKLDKRTKVRMATYKQVNALSSTDAAYVAGLIDGEGAISLSRSTARIIVNSSSALAILRSLSPC